MNSRLIILLAIICGLLTADYGPVCAQEKLEVDGDLKIESTATDQRSGLILNPKTSAPSPASEGQVYYDDTANKPKYYDGAWKELGGASGDKTVATRIVAASNSLGTTGCPAACTNPRADSTCSGTQTTGGDEVTINAAIDALATTGGAVYLLEGTYWITDMIKVRSNVAIIGAGAGTVISLKNSATLNNYGVINNYDTTNGNTNILLSNFRIDGNKANNAGLDQYGVCFYKVTCSKIDKLWVENMWRVGVYLYSSSNNNTILNNDIQNNRDGGITLYGANNNTLSGNNIQSNGLYGILFYSSNSNNTISGNNIQNNSSHGIYFNTNNNNTLSGNNIQNNGGNGISLYSSNNNTLSGNNIQSNSQYGILFSVSKNHTLSGNNIQSNGSHSIYIYNASNNNTISGNIIYDNGGTGSLDGVYIKTNCDNNLLSSNLLYDSAGGTGRPINIADSTCDNTYIIGNLIAGWPSGYEGIIDSGTGTKYTQKEKITIERQAAVAPTAGSTLNAPVGGKSTPKAYLPLAPASNVTLSTITAIADGTAVGDILILEGGTNTVTIEDNANTQLASTADSNTNGTNDWVLGLEDTLKLIWNGTDWVEIGSSNNSP